MKSQLAAAALVAAALVERGFAQREEVAADTAAATEGHNVDGGAPRGGWSVGAVLGTVVVCFVLLGALAVHRRRRRAVLFDDSYRAMGEGGDGAVGAVAMHAVSVPVPVAAYQPPVSAVENEEAAPVGFQTFNLSTLDPSQFQL